MNSKQVLAENYMHETTEGLLKKQEEAERNLFLKDTAAQDKTGFSAFSTERLSQ